MSETRGESLDRLDYDLTVQQLRALAEIRFRLLAFVPTITGAAVAFLSDADSAAQLAAVGAVGLVATLGLFAYELGNTQTTGATARRARELERRIGFEAVAGAGGGPLSARPDVPARLFGVVGVRAEAGVGLVYAAALGGWTYLAVWGLLGTLDMVGARPIGALAGIAAAAAVAAERPLARAVR